MTAIAIELFLMHQIAGVAARIAETAICRSYDSTIEAVIAISMMVGAVVVVAISCSCGSNKQHSCFGNSNSSVGARMLDVVGEQ